MSTRTSQSGARRVAARSAVLGGVVLVMTLGMATGCNLIGFAALVHNEATPKSVDAKYKGLNGQRFALIVYADRAIMADFPGVTDQLTTTINETLSAELPRTAGEQKTETSYVPPLTLLSWLANHPRWRTMLPEDLGKKLGVDRLVLIELYNFQLNDPGNRYLWKGEAVGSIRVYELNTALPNDPMFDENVAVRFPDMDGYTEADMSAATVTAALLQRFTLRAAWLFFDHKEDRRIDF